MISEEESAVDDAGEELMWPVCPDALSIPRSKLFWAKASFRRSPW